MFVSFMKIVLYYVAKRVFLQLLICKELFYEAIYLPFPFILLCFYYYCVRSVKVESGLFRLYKSV